MKLVFITFFLSALNLYPNVLYENILSSFPSSKKLLYSGSKYLVGTLELHINAKKDENNKININTHEKVYILGIKAHESVIDSELKMKRNKPVSTIYKDFRKNTMRFNFFYDTFYRYIRITNFKDLIKIDEKGKILSPKDFKPKKHSVKNRKLSLEVTNTLVFDPNSLIVALPYLDKKLIETINKMKLVFTTMDHKIPFKLKIKKETKHTMNVMFEYDNKYTNKFDLKFEEIIIDKKKKVLSKIIASEKHVGKVQVSLKEYDVKN